MNNLRLVFKLLVVSITLSAASSFAQYRPDGSPSPYQQSRYHANQQWLTPQAQRSGQTVVPGVNGPTPQAIVDYALKPNDNYARHPFPRFAGEFERQRAILLSVSDLMYQHHGVLSEIVEKTSGRVPLVILVNDSKQLATTVDLLGPLDCDLSHVSFYQFPLDTIWLRDFGPRIAETQNGSASFDYYYDGQRPLDDKFPIRWGDLVNAEVKQIQWTLHGGNLLSNGQGLAIASSRLFEDNFIRFEPSSRVTNAEFERRRIVVDAMKQDNNINELMILEPVQPEATKHVDMFATLLAKDLVVVAEVDARQDPVNARILDENVNRLRQLKVDGQPMRVARIAIPPRDGKFWSPYTNIILANDLILMPVYQSDPPALVRAAIETYQKLVPSASVETIDMTSMRKLEGALHCMSINVPEFSTLPSNLISFESAQSQLGKAFAARNQTRPSLQDNRVGENGLADGSPSTDPRTESNNQAASLTYRRIFTDRSQNFTLDAYAIGLVPQGIVLLRVDKRTEVVVALGRLSDDDQNWVAKNDDKIRENGFKVKRFLLSQQR